MGNFGGSTSTRKTVVYFFLIFLRILIRVISVWSLDAVNMPTRLVLGNPWMEETSNASCWEKEKLCAGAYIANIQERQWRVSLRKKESFLKVSRPRKNLIRITFASDYIVWFVSFRILRGGIIDSPIGFRFEWGGRQ